MKMSENPKCHIFIEHANNQLGSGDTREDQIECNHQEIKQYRSRVVRLRNTSMILNSKAKFQEIHLNANIRSIQERVQYVMKLKNLKRNVSLKKSMPC